MSDLQAIAAVYEQMDLHLRNQRVTEDRAAEAPAPDPVDEEQRINDQAYFVLAWGQLEADLEDACREAIREGQSYYDWRPPERVVLTPTAPLHDVLSEHFPRCDAAGVPIIVGALFASGILATGGRDGATYRYAEPPPEVLQWVRAMEAVCHRYGVDLATAAVQFLLAHPLVAAAIPGATCLEYVTGNVQRLQTPVPADLWAELKSEGLLRPDAPVPGIQ